MAFVAPAGIRLSLADVARGVGGGLARDALERLNAQLADVSGRRHVRLVSTGRAGMALALHALRRAASDPRRCEVVFPGYTCYSVPASVERAGLVPRICDVDPATLSPDPDSLARIDFSRVLAIVSANLYGLPNALVDLESLARRHGVFLVDDAAQALAARYKGRPVGGFGDVGLYSFDKGKNITTLQGGVLVVDSGEFLDALDATLAERLQAKPHATFATLLKLPAYAALLRPSLYGLIRNLPIGLGLTPWETDYPFAPYSRSLAGLASLQLEQLELITATRVGNATRLREALEGLPGVTSIRVLPEAEPVYPRYPVLVESARRAALIAALERAGIGATASYPSALIDVPEVAQRLPADQLPTPGARDVASRIVTLPTHGYVPPDLAGRVAAVVRRA
jgi:dTDP-4-amino-4,6-dideoxygalactose transaminase